MLSRFVRHLRQFAKGECAPIFLKWTLSALSPGRIGADAGDAGEQIDVAHHFAEDRPAESIPSGCGTAVAVQEPEPAGANQQVDVMAADFLFVRREVHVVLNSQAELRQLERGRVVRVPLAHQPKFPAALLAKRGELVLAQDVRGEAVRVVPVSRSASVIR